MDSIKYLEDFNDLEDNIIIAPVQKTMDDFNYVHNSSKKSFEIYKFNSIFYYLCYYCYK
jgi:hypothetical protein